MNQAVKQTDPIGKFERPQTGPNTKKPTGTGGKRQPETKNLDEATQEQRAKLISVAKWVTLYMALSLLIVYWWTDGQMAMSAAVPSLYVCAMLMGGAIGRSTKKEDHDYENR